MAGVESRAFDSADETRTPDKTRIEVVRLGSTTAARMSLSPGWSWAECIKPVVGGESCQNRHVGVLQSGTMRVRRPSCPSCTCSSTYCECLVIER